MPPRLPDHVQVAMRMLLFETDHSVTFISQRLQVHRTTIYRMRLSWELFGQPYPPATCRRGRPAILTGQQLEYLFKYLDLRPTAYLDEMMWYLYDQFGIILNEKTLWGTLSRECWSRKVCKKVSQQRNEQLRAQWQAKRLFWRNNRICTVDESASNERTADRKYGWSPKGIPARDLHSLKRSERWSILPAMTIDGWLPNPLIHQGSVDREMFLEWLEHEVLPRLGAGWILIMDNASIHRGQEVKDLVKDHGNGTVLEYLPPYSPDLNPIESSFQILKAWIRRNQQEVDRWGDFGDFLRWAVVEVGGIHARNHFIEAGYTYEGV